VGRSLSSAAVQLPATSSAATAIANATQKTNVVNQSASTLKLAHLFFANVDLLSSMQLKSVLPSW